MNTPSLLFARHRASVAGVASLLLAGCASLSSPPEQVVAARAAERWQAIQAGAMDKAFSYHTPKAQQGQTLEQYRLNFGAPGHFRKVDVVSVICTAGGPCTARIRLETPMPFAAGAPRAQALGAPGQPRQVPSIVSHVDERWVLQGRSWLLDQAR